jgi:hypothetical protein
MRGLVLGLVSAGSFSMAAFLSPDTADAGCFGCWVGAGVLGGFAAGAIVGNAIANSPPPYYYYPPPYYPPPPLAGPPPAAAYPPPAAYAALGPGCHWGNRRVWVEGYGYQWRTVPVCP